MTHPIPSRARVLFPDVDISEYAPFDTADGYDPIIRSFGHAVVTVKDDDYSGDTRVLLLSSCWERYGFLIVGWGSCSGCDELMGCRTFEEVDALINRLENGIVWFDSLADAKCYIADSDARSLSYYGSGEGWCEFQEKVAAYEPNREVASAAKSCEAQA